MWLLIILFTLILYILGIIYLIRKISKTFNIRKLYSFIIILILNIIITFIFSLTNAMIITINFILVSLIFDLILLIIKKNRYSKIIFIMVLLFNIIYFSYGYYTNSNVVETKYDIYSDKLNDDYKIVLISDSHLSTSLDSDGLKKVLDKLEDIDMILIAGDFVDDSTKKDDMINAIKYLGNVNTKYGIYFVYGNHDKGYYGSNRGFNSDDLENEFNKNNITVLKDESILINDDIYLIGRKDAEDRNRLSIDELVNDLDDKYKIVIDHQPTDYDNEKNKVDLVLSGHTHGGQLIPLNFINTLISNNYSVYGLEELDNTNFIVSSGISGWDLRFKTGCVSEYVIINVKRNS